MNGESAVPRRGAFSGDPVMPEEPGRTPSLEGWRPPERDDASGAPDYGLDSPWLVAKTAAFTLFAVLAGAGLSYVRIGGRKITLAAATCWWLGLGGAALCASLLAYAKLGKFNHRDRVLSLVTWDGDERVLDIGTGRGLLMIGAAKHLTTGRAIGIDTWREEDLSGNNRENTMRNAFLEGVVDKVDVRFADARKLEFSRSSFDLVLSTLTLHCIDTKAGREAACQEIARVLKPGGVAIVSDNANVGEYAAAFRAAGLDVAVGPVALDTFAYVRTLVARKSPLVGAASPVPTPTVEGDPAL